MNRNDSQLNRDGGNISQPTFEEFRRMRAQETYDYQRFSATIGGLNQDQMNEGQQRRMYQLFLDAQAQPSQSAKSPEYNSRIEASQPQGAGCCRSHGRGCGAAHGAVHYAETLSGDDGEPALIPVAEDSGTAANWIPPRFVSLFGFKRRAVSQPKSYSCFTGAQFQPKDAVIVPLWNKSMPTTKYIEFFVAPPDFPAKFLMVGTTFIEEHGNIWALFGDEPDNNALIIVEAKMSEMEKKQKAEAKKQADKEAAKLKERRDKDKQKVQASKTASNAQSSSASSGQNSGSSRRS